MTAVIRLRYPSPTQQAGFGTIEVHPPYPAQEHTASWMRVHLDAHRDAEGVVDTNALFRAAMRHDGVSWQPWTPQESAYRKLAVYVAHAAGQPWHL
jgi:hypothetical protein